MTPETVAHIFEPFFSTKEKGKGTGLGLSTVYGIVKQSRGSISVYSEPGRGSRFQMLFPAAAVALEPARPAPASTPRPGSETIVLAEDEPGVRKYVREVLERRGYLVLEATNGKAAMEAALRHQGRIGLLLTDVVMPEVGGMELAAQFAAAFPEVPVLFMSGYNERLRRREMELNFIQKPFTPAILLNEVRRVLDTARGAAG
jgi:two-component system, cell cycle sensor histidine kinase and response regulator CckA